MGSRKIFEMLEELGEVPDDMKESILSQHDLQILTRWLKAAAKARSIEEFEKSILLTD